MTLEIEHEGGAPAALLFARELAGRGRRAQGDGEAGRGWARVELDQRSTPRRGPGVRAPSPKGRFVLSQAAGGGRALALLFANGSGITPVISIVKTALATTGRSARVLLCEPRRAVGRSSRDEDRRARAAAPRSTSRSVHRRFDDVHGWVDAQRRARGRHDARRGLLPVRADAVHGDRRARARPTRVSLPRTDAGRALRTSPGESARGRAPPTASAKLRYRKRSG